MFFELADIAANARRGRMAAAISPIALEAVKRIDALFDIERAINGLPVEERLRVRKRQSAPVLAALQAWLREERPKLSRSASVAQPIDYLLRRWYRFAEFLDDGRILPDQQCRRAGTARLCDGPQVMAIRRLRARRRPRRRHGHADRHCRLNDVDPQAWLADVLGRIAGIPQSRLHELLPRNWRPTTAALEAA